MSSLLGEHAQNILNIDFFPQRTPKLEARIEAFIADIREDLGEITSHYFPQTSNVYKNLTAKDIDFATDIACYCFNKVCLDFYDASADHNQYKKTLPILIPLARKTWTLDVEVLVQWLRKMLEISENSKATKSKDYINIENWPLGSLVQMILRKAKNQPLSKTQVTQIRAMLDWEQFQPDYEWFDATIIRLRINEILQLSETGSKTTTEIKPYLALGGDNFGLAVEERLATLSQEDAQIWHSLMHLAVTAVGSKPTKNFMGEVEELTTSFGKEKLRSVSQELLTYAVSAKKHSEPWEIGEGRHIATLDYEVLFTNNNAYLLKGVVWVASLFQDIKTINLIADLCEKAMTKIKGKGPASQAAANACLNYLEQTPGEVATIRLSRFSTIIKQKVVQKRVKAIVAEKAKAVGITTIQLEERVVPEYGLVAGTKSIEFEDYKLKITVEGVNKTSQTWIKPDGSVQKTKPKFITDKAALRVKFDKLKNEVAVLKKIITAQRNRIDLLFGEALNWPLEEVEKYYVAHGLIGVIASRLIWSLTTDDITTGAIWRNDHWEDVVGNIIKTDASTTAQLWHPIDWDLDVTLAWRERMRELEIIQPMKQAYREVYLITDAEINTKTYSNRMAAHMLKQHQMATLMAARGWGYQLMGAYDDGIDNVWASKKFVTSDLTAQYLIHSNWDDDYFNEAGIFLYVGTDQLRFTRGDETVELEHVPPRLFSETMREADLFVGVASVGNDPAWADQGTSPEGRTYWQSYSFGNLDNFAEMRKQVLETLLPRLKIRDLAHIEGKYLIVDGKINTYKIHLGSSNILITPGDRYLCIVPKSVRKSKEINLPFEGDNRLSVILSKALMLADDDKITDKTIVSQLNRKRE